MKRSNFKRSIMGLLYDEALRRSDTYSEERVSVHINIMKLGEQLRVCVHLNECVSKVSFIAVDATK